MMRYALVVWFTILQIAVALGGDAKINGTDKPVPVNSFAELSISAKDGDLVSWQVYPVPVKKVDDGKGKLYFSGPPGCVYTVSVTVVNFDSKRFDTGNANVTMDGGDPAQMKKVKDAADCSTSPKPKPPVSAFQKEMQAAYDQEPDKTLKDQLFAVYQNAGNNLVKDTKLQTWGQLFNAMAQDARTRGLTLKFMIVQKVIQKELQSSLPWSDAADQPLDATGRQKAAQAFQKIALAIGRLK